MLIYITKLTTLIFDLGSIYNLGKAIKHYLTFFQSALRTREFHV